MSRINPFYAMTARLTDALPQGQVIAEHFDFAAYRCIMDVAGGPGGQSIAIGVRHPHLRGIITDMEPVCVVARENDAADQRVRSAG